MSLIAIEQKNGVSSLSSSKNQNLKDDSLVSSLLARGVSQISQVYSTFNYELFKTASANRTTDEAHIEHLVESYDIKYLVVPIIVNEFFEIIDGQHRFEAAKIKGYPINFIINEGYGIMETQLLNTTMKNWTINDFTDFYCRLGKKDYITYKEFRLTYNFGHMESLAILLNSMSNFSKTFRAGNLVIKDLKKAEDIAKKIQDFGQYYKGYKKNRFVFAMLTILQHPEYDHELMLHKVSLQQRALVDCTTVAQQTELLEEIYNYKSRKGADGKKIRFD